MNTSTLVSPPALVKRDEKHDTAAVQALDSAHFIHPFTDHADLAAQIAAIAIDDQLVILVFAFGEHDAGLDPREGIEFPAARRFLRCGGRGHQNGSQQ